jgi:DNA transformation protein
MARSSEFLQLVLEQMRGLGSVNARSMFGGYGLYWDALFFALISDDTLYFKADAETQAEFESRTLPRFRYTARGKEHALMYYQAPPEVYDEAHAMAQWARLALAAAVRARKPARSAKPRRKT